MMTDLEWLMWIAGFVAFVMAIVVIWLIAIGLGE
jgi:hypothetical protein